MEENYICKKCELPIDDIAEVMVTGCQCGCRVFKQVKHHESVEHTSFVDNPDADDQISIRVKASGIYDVNLKALLGRDTNDDPIFVEDQRGKINVIFNPDP